MPMETPLEDNLNLLKLNRQRNLVEKGPASLTLREQESVRHFFSVLNTSRDSSLRQTIDQLNKKIWSLQLKIHYLEERLDQSQPETHQAVSKQNVALKIEVHTLETELKKTKKLTLRLEKELESLGASAERERELEQLLADRERELREIRKSRSGHLDGDESMAALQAAEERVMDLEDHAEALEGELDTARRQIDENINEIDKLQEALQEQPDGPRITELSEQNGELRERLADHEESLASRDEEREELLDETEGLRLEIEIEIENMPRRGEAEAAERLGSRKSKSSRTLRQEDRHGLRRTR
jgi:chromosome segregation ATPase